ncbi:hypothetical protein PTNB73_10054 [Pyrenophora teres f. teres]|nr:hypothetical protein HRS9139_09864 [Pyrenophora teres f. teres]KAE8823669.1 hypothetical protein PTNB85_10171 [Pyrenophora teres f. teres]KAE8833946.1 hypothetical protein HRS9122_08026 [Pyrenophora teres f. teres]KAE8854630.1 hypothetical protein PTNB29_09986 [Pyrenophora teres f. teres]KAE8855768.1 hypothetical protein PTNB73_10054 [Pyrenophora teres f. teres]
MKRFPNPFHSHRPRPLTTTTTTPAAAPPGPPTPPPSTPTLPSGASSIQNYVCEARRQIEWLQGRLDSAADMGQVNEIKRALKGVHRGLEKVHVEQCAGQGEEVGDEVQGVGFPTSGEDERQPRAKSRRRYLDGDVGEELYLMSGALPVEHDTRSIPARASSPDLLAETPRKLSIVETNPEQIPQPRHEVKRRLQHEEDNSSFELLEPDTVRRGSCNGFMITEMTMRGLQDASFVLPYLHYMKIHELRWLKEWLVHTGHITQSQPVSRMEKMLLCMQVLQSGCRYEAVAVIHSRSPRQVKAACNEVMQGLLHWHALTVRERDVGDQAKSLVLWGIWDRYCASDGRAGLYFGFNWTHVAKVLVALNLYMGRWRMQGRFATDGPAFAWGSFFELETETEEEHQLCSDVDDESFEAEEPSVHVTRRRMPRDRVQAER